MFELQYNEALNQASDVFLPSIQSYLQQALMIWSGNRNLKVSISCVTSLRSDGVSVIVCPWHSAVIRIKSTYTHYQCHRIFWPLEKSLPATCIQYAIIIVYIVG